MDLAEAQGIYRCAYLLNGVRYHHKAPLSQCSEMMKRLEEQKPSSLNLCMMMNKARGKHKLGLICMYFCSADSLLHLSVALIGLFIFIMFSSNVAMDGCLFIVII